MSSHRKNPDFVRISHALGLQPFDAARHVLDRVERGKPVPRWMRRAARAVTRRSQAA